MTKFKPAVYIAKPFSPKEAVCQFMGWNYDDANDYRYHAGMTSIPVYSTPDGYICATSNGKKVPKRVVEYIGNDDPDVVFVEATGLQAEYCKARGKTIWVCTTTN